MSFDLSPPLAVSLALLLGAAVTGDLRAHRIPNWLSLGGLAAAVVLQFATRGSDGVAAAMQGALTGALMLLPLWLLRGLAAGDVKLMAAVGAHLGSAATIAAALATLMAGALGALLVLLLRRRTAHPQAQPSGRCERLDGGFAYAPAIAVGTAIAVVLPPLGRMFAS